MQTEIDSADRIGPDAKHADDVSSSLLADAYERGDQSQKNIQFDCFCCG